MKRAEGLTKGADYTEGEDGGNCPHAVRDDVTPVCLCRGGGERRKKQRKGKELTAKLSARTVWTTKIAVLKTCDQRNSLAK